MLIRKLNVLMETQKGVDKQTQVHQEREEHTSTFDINERSRKVHLHGPINK